jgi:phospholipase/lecithinase/hemolysin
MRPTLHRRLLALVVGVAGCVSSAHAGYTGLTFFGDSLSDTGNVYALTSVFQPPPFPDFPGAPGRFSNGPVWTESFASALGMAAASDPSRLLYNGSAVVPIGAPGGQNYAYGGARTGLGGSAGATTGLFGQLIAWNGAAFTGSLTRAADPNALYVVMAGANDMRDFRSGSPGALDPSQAALNIVNAIALLAQSGARHFLVSNLADLGRTPEAALLGRQAESTAATLGFNAALGAGLALLDAQYLLATGIDLDLRSLDLFRLGADIVDDALNNGGATYGITNVLSPCITPGPVSGQYFAPDAVAVGCDTAAFSDPLHPSSAVHALIARAAVDALDIAEVAEPASRALVVVALLAAAAGTRRRRLTIDC